MNDRDSIPARQYGITLLRVSPGIMWIAHALLKWFVFTLPGTARYFESVGFPGFLAYPVFGIELLGGLALVLGVYPVFLIVTSVAVWLLGDGVAAVRRSDRLVPTA